MSNLLRMLVVLGFWVIGWPTFVLAWTLAALIDGPIAGHKAWREVFSAALRRYDNAR